MSDAPDGELLERFVRNASETAFAELVERHVHLVHSVAIRHTADPQQAQDITQAVFILLAQRAKSLKGNPVLAGWLYQTVRLTAANWRRSEQRRIRREQEIVMDPGAAEGQPDATWQELAPQLEEAMSQLSTKDRDAIVLRYFQNKSLQEISTALGIDANAAHKRVSRAVEKLRKQFSQQGVTLSATLLAGCISANAVNAAPAPLAATLAAGALQAGTLGPGVNLLVQGTAKTMMTMQLKSIVGIGAAALVLGGITTVMFTQKAVTRAAPTPQGILEETRRAYAGLMGYSDDGQTVSTVNGMNLTNSFSIKLARPNLYRIEWNQQIFPGITNSGAVWSGGEGDFFKMGNAPTRKEANRNMALGSATGVSGGAAATIPAAFFNNAWGDTLSGGSSGHDRLPDERVGGIDCYVLSSTSSKRIRTLWIGKTDYLIRRSQVVTSADAMKAALAEAARRNPDAAALAKKESSGTTITETHGHILTNPKMSQSDFAP